MDYTFRYGKVKRHWGKIKKYSFVVYNYRTCEACVNQVALSLPQCLSLKNGDPLSCNDITI